MGISRWLTTLWRTVTSACLAAAHSPFPHDVVGGLLVDLWRSNLGGLLRIHHCEKGRLVADFHHTGHVSGGSGVFSHHSGDRLTNESGPYQTPWVCGVLLVWQDPACAARVACAPLLGGQGGYTQVVNFYMGGKLKLDELIGRTIPLREIDTVFELLEGGEVARSIIPCR